MAKIKFPTGTAWKEYELDTELISPPILKLKLRPTFKRDTVPAIFTGGSFQTSASFRASAAVALEVVEGWDLEGEDGKPIPCNDDTKKQYLDALLWENVKPEAPKEGEEAAPKKTFGWLWTEILKFARDLGNFSKN